MLQGKKKNLPAHYAEGKQRLAFEVPEQAWKKGLKSFYFSDPAGNVLEIVPEGIWN